ncbi:MAG: stalk domain-containing protein [Armatimonadota bacterium]|nr:stalk domain-containing protein [Armatimonadota bacterium]
MKAHAVHKRQAWRAGCVALALVGSGLHNAANAAIQVHLNGQPLATSVPPMNLRGRTVVPMRDIFEALGASVQWNPVSQGITATKGATTINLQINNRSASINGRQVWLAQPPLLHRGSTMVPLRFVSEALGANVDWNPNMELVSIDTGASNVATAPLGGAPLANTPASGSAVAGFRTISVPEGVVVPVKMDTTISSENASPGQTFMATVVSQRLGDSEFPVNSKIEGMVVEARSKEGNRPGVLDFDFRAVILPDGTRYPLRGQLIALDNENITTSQGRIVARSDKPSTGDKLKVVGIGAGLGFVLGKVLDANTTLTTILGAAGGYLYSRHKDAKAAEAVVAQGTRLGVRLTDPVTYTDTTNYLDYRQTFLRSGVDAASPYLTETVNPPLTRNQEPTQTAALPPPAPAYTSPTYTQPAYAPPAYTPPAAPAYNPNNAALPPANSAPAYAPPTYAPPTYAPPATYPPATAPAYRTEPVDQFPGQSVAGYRTISVPAGAVVPVRLDSTLSSATAHVGDRFTASVVSQRLGDSEFPAGSKLEGMVVEARPKTGNDPGVLDLDFRTVVMPDGSRLPVRGELIALDQNSVETRQGRVVAKAKSQSTGDKLKIIGIGAGIGYVVGKVLDKSTTVTTVLGGIGGYLFGRSRDKKAAEAVVPQGTRLGVRLNDRLVYNDTTGYATPRMTYLRVGDANVPDYDGAGDFTPHLYTPEPANTYTTGNEGPGYNPTYPDTGYTQPGYQPGYQPSYPGQAVAGMRTISVPEGAVVPVTIDTRLSSTTSHAGDRFTTSVISERMGDSEFPVGSKIEGVVVEARPKQGDSPGVLDLEFRNVILPDGTRVPLNAQLANLDDTKSVTTTKGRMMSKMSTGDKIKIVGIGAGIGFILGKVLDKNTTLTTVLGALGGYLYGRSKDKNQASEAVLAQGTRLGVRLNDTVTYADSTGYADYRVNYLRS